MNNPLDTVTDLLLEAKQVGTVYHFTSLSNIFYILEENILRPGIEFGSYYISLTRDSRFTQTTTYGEDFSICLVLDGDKLSSKYKIEPFSYFYHDARYRNIPVPDASIRHTPDYESEERLYSNMGITNLRSYIKEIVVIKSNFKRELSIMPADVLAAASDPFLKYYGQIITRHDLRPDIFLDYFVDFVEDIYKIPVKVS